MPSESPVPDISVVIPAFNSGPYLETTVSALERALDRTSWNAEILIVDDGSTDETADVVQRIADDSSHHVRRVAQDNQGVFLSVWNGLQQAKSEAVLILNSRLLLHEASLAHLESHGALRSHTPWNGHVVTDPTVPLVGLFWEVPLRVFWGSYLARPAVTEITSENFDRVPKGTGCLLIRRDLMIDAYKACWPEENARFTSDDTKLLRYVAAASPMRLDPGFSATYRPRTTLRKFLLHAAGRGTMFVDSYAGTSTLRNWALIALVVLPPVFVVSFVLAALTGRRAVVAVLSSAAVGALIGPALIAARRRAPGRSVAAYALYILPFGVAFWRGLVRGVRLHRGAFTRRSDAGHQ